MARFFVGLELVDPGLVQVHQWRPDPGGSAPEGVTDYLQADLRDPGAILDRAAALLDFGQPVAVMLLGVLHLIQDAEDPWGIVVALMTAMTPGS